MAERTSRGRFNHAAFEKFLKETTGKEVPRWGAVVTRLVEMAHAAGKIDASKKANYRAALDYYNQNYAIEPESMLPESKFFTGLPKAVGSTIGDRFIEAELQYDGYK